MRQDLILNIHLQRLYVITSNRSYAITSIASGNALVKSVPSVYAGMKNSWKVLSGVCWGMSKNGWSNTQVFLNYLIKHFAKYVKLTEGKTSERV